MHHIIDNLADKLINLISIIIFLIVSIKLIITTIKVLHKSIYMLLNYINKSNHISNLKDGILILEDLQDLSSSEFQYWCSLFLDREGYSNIKIISNSIDTNKNMICHSGTIELYVECRKYTYSKYDINKIDLETCRNFIGTMEGNKILDSIIITSGIITKEAKNYLYSLPKDFNIKIYDGKDLLKIHENYRNTLLESINIY